MTIRISTYDDSRLLEPKIRRHRQEREPEVKLLGEQITSVEEASDSRYGLLWKIDPQRSSSFQKVHHLNQKKEPSQVVHMGVGYKDCIYDQRVDLVSQKREAGTLTAVEEEIQFFGLEEQ
jgi:hypothetical protein